MKRCRVGGSEKFNFRFGSSIAGWESETAVDAVRAKQEKRGDRMTACRKSESTNNKFTVRKWGASPIPKKRKARGLISDKLAKRTPGFCGDCPGSGAIGDTQGTFF